MPRARRFARLLCGVRALFGKKRIGEKGGCKIFQKETRSGRATKAGPRGKQPVPPTAPGWRRFFPRRIERGEGRALWTRAGFIHGTPSKDGTETRADAKQERASLPAPVFRFEGSPSPAFQRGVPEKSGAHRLQRRRAPSVLPGGPEPLSPRAARARGRPAFCAKSRRAGTRRG